MSVDIISSIDFQELQNTFKTNIHEVSSSKEHVLPQYKPGRCHQRNWSTSPSVSISLDPYNHRKGYTNKHYRHDVCSLKQHFPSHYKPGRCRQSNWGKSSLSISLDSHNHIKGYTKSVEKKSEIVYKELNYYNIAKCDNAKKYPNSSLGNSIEDDSVKLKQKTEETGEHDSKDTKESQVVVTLPPSPGVIKRTEYITDPHYYTLLYQYNKFIYYSSETYSFRENIDAWNLQSQHLQEGFTSLQINTAIQLHIFSRCLDFPMFIKSKHNINNSRYFSLKRLLELVSKTNSPDQNYIESKICICLSFENTLLKKYGIAQELLTRANSCLQNTEPSEYQAWFYLASAFLHDHLRRCHPQKENLYRELTFNHLERCRDILQRDAADSKIYCTEYALVLWWMFLVKCNLTDIMPRLLEENYNIDKLEEEIISKNTSLEDLCQADQLYEQFQIQMERSNWLPMKDQYLLFDKVRKTVKIAKDLHLCQKRRIGRQKPAERTVTAASDGDLDSSENDQVITKGERKQKDVLLQERLNREIDRHKNKPPAINTKVFHSYFLKQTNRSRLPPCVQACFFDVDKGCTVLLIEDGTLNEVKQYVKRACPLLVNRVQIREARIVFAVKEKCESVDSMAARKGYESWCERTTYGEKTTKFTFGSEIFPIKTEHVKSVLEDDSIYMYRNIKDKPHLIAIGSGSLGCFCINDNQNFFIITCQHVIDEFQEGKKTHDDINHAICSQVKHSKDLGAEKEVFLIGEKFYGNMDLNTSVPKKVMVYSRTNEMDPKNGSKTAISLKEENEKFKQDTDDEQEYINIEQIIPVTHVLDMAAIEIPNDLSKKAIFQPQLQNSKGEPVGITMSNQSIKPGTHVQMYSSVSGYRQGKVIDTNIAVNVNHWILKDCFLVQGIHGNTPFAVRGDSGSLVTESTDDKTIVSALGLVHRLCETKEGTYAICINFTHNLKELNSSFNLGLKLDNSSTDSGIGTEGAGM